MRLIEDLVRFSSRQEQKLRKLFVDDSSAIPTISCAEASEMIWSARKVSDSAAHDSFASSVYLLRLLHLLHLLILLLPQHLQFLLS
jgi:hypothetical protein